MHQETTYVGWCKHQLSVAWIPNTNVYVLGQACSHCAEGTPIEHMAGACQTCPYNQLDLPAIWRSQLAVAPPAQPPATDAPQPQPAQPDQLTTMLPMSWLLDQPDVNTVVETALAPLGLGGAPSEGGISWHSLEHTRCWLRAFRAHVLGLRKKIEGEALAIGTLYHACLERYYSSGGNPDRTFEPCEAVRLAGAADVAHQVRELVTGRLTHPVYSLEEGTTWCPRAVEQNAVAWLEPVKINGKTHHIPVTCRHDLLVHLRQPHEPAPGPGPADGMHIVDYKTTAQLTADLIKGYALDGQLMTNIWCYLEAEQAEFGRLRGVIVDVAAKHKRLTPDSYQRVRDAIDLPAVGRFYHDELMAYGVELYRRLVSPEYMRDQSRWSMDRKQCVGKWLCPYYDLCAFGEGEMHQYKVIEGRILRPETFAAQPKGWMCKSAPPPTVEITTATEQKKAVRGEKKASKEAFAVLLVESIFEGLEGMDLFNPKHYMVAGHTRKSVEVALIESLMVQFKKSFEASLVKQDKDPAESATATLSWMLDGGGEALLSLRERGLSWSSDAGKGTIYWRAIAERICKDWWDLSRVEQTMRNGAVAQVSIPKLPFPPPPSAAELAASIGDRAADAVAEAEAAADQYADDSAGGQG